MDLSFKVSGRIARPVSEVFEAVVDPKKLSGYFTTGGATGRLETGSTVTWDFADFPGAFPVRVEKVVPNKQIVLHWGSADDAPEGEEFKPHDNIVTMDFEQLDDGRTLVSITETGWRDTAKGLKASYGNCEGWTGMLCALKVYVERGFNLREGFYK
jgi:uncharacterized protein YndB with AHSA1/START domain